MPQAFAGALQQPVRIVESRPAKKADIHMDTEGVDVPKRRITHTRSGMAIVQKLANIRSAGAHLLKPWQGEPSQLVISFGKPGVNRRVSLDGAWEPQEFAHEFRPQRIRADPLSPHKYSVHQPASR